MPISNWAFSKLLPLISGVVMSSDIADSPVMEEMDDNQGLIIICNASYEHYLTIYVSLFSEAFNKSMKKYSHIFYFHVVVFSFVT